MKFSFGRHLKKAFHWLLHELWILFAIIVVLFAVFISSVRIFSPFISWHREELIALSSRLIGQPVQISGVEVAWYRIEPVLRLHQVILLDPVLHQPQFSIEQLDIGFNLWQSILRERLQLGLLGISGARVIVERDAQKQFHLLGIENLAKNVSPSPEKTPHGQVVPFLSYLFSVSKIYLNQFVVDYSDTLGHEIPVVIQNMKLSNNFSSHYISGWISPMGDPRTQVNIKAKFNGGTDFYNYWDGKLYLASKYINLSVISELLNLTHPFQGFVELQNWFDYSKNQLKQVNGTVVINQLQFKWQTKKTAKLDQVTFNYHWGIFDDNHWDFYLNPLIIHFNGFSYSPIHLHALVEKVGEYQSLQSLSADHVPIEPIIKIAHQLLQPNPNDILEKLNQIKLKGWFDGLHYEKTNSINQPYKVNANFTKLSWQPWHGFPGLNQISGQILTNGQQISLKVFGQAVEVNAPELYSQIKKLDQLDLSFILNQQSNLDWQLLCQPFHIVTQGARLDGQFKWSQLNQQKPVLSLESDLSHLNSTIINSWLPERGMPKSLQWLQQAFKAGEFTQSHVLFAGHPDEFPFTQQSGTFKVFSQFNDLDFHFDSKWPDLTHLSGILNWNNQQLNVLATQAQIYQAPIKTLSAHIDDLGHKPPILQIQASLDNHLERAQAFINDYYRSLGLKQNLSQFNLAGPMKLNLNLTIPLDSIPNDSVTRGLIQFNQAEFILKTMPFKCENMNGTLQFIGAELSASGIQANCLQKPLVISLASQKKPDDALNVNLQGQWSSAELFSGSPLKPFISGQALATINFYIPSGSNPTTVTLQSDLNGVTVSLPEPLGKKHDEKIALMAKTTLRSDHQYPLEIDYGDRVHALLNLHQLEQHWLFDRAEIIFGVGKNFDGALKNGITILGNIPKLSFSEWQSVWQKIKVSTQNISSHHFSSNLHPISLQSIDVDIGSFEILNHLIQKFNFKLEPQDNAWHAEFSGQDIGGVVDVPYNFDQTAITANLNHLYLDQKSGTSDMHLDRGSIHPEEIPKLHLNIDDLSLDQRNLGALNIMTRPMPNGIFIDNISLTQAIYRISATGKWYGQDVDQTTELQGDFFSPNFSQFLTAWRFPAFLENKNFNAQFNFRWSRAPFDLDLASMDGELDIKAGEGQVTHLTQNVKVENDLGRILTLLSVESLPRRLLFHFNDLTQQGFSYDHLNGRIVFHQGTASSDNLTIKGVVADVTIHGDVDLIGEQWHLLVGVTPHVMASLPLVATLTGGPIAGVATYVADKLLTPVVDRMTTRYYSVNGDWANPQIERVKV